jgi:hypothetical protein
MVKRSMVKTKEDLDLNNIVPRCLDKAAATMKLPQGVLSQIKACNAVYSVQFPDQKS